MLKASEVLAATKAVCADFEFTGVTTDSRAVKPGELFVALKGDNFDGHDYCAKAVELGAAGVVVSHEVSGLPAGVAVFMVKDTLLAYQQLAHAYRQRKQGLKVFAITGSNGKTSTKDLLAACLSCKYNVVKTQGNFNNEIGLPKTLLSIQPDTDIAVVEMGMRGLGQIAELCRIAEPDSGLITNVGETHMELLGSMENIGKVSGAFEIDMDAAWISSLLIMDGWHTFKIKDVSAAVYHATRSLHVPLEYQWHKFINHLDGKQIEPESFASAEIGGLRPLEKGDILCIDGPFPTDRELKFRLDLSSYGVQKEVLNLMTDCSKPENSLEITCSYDAARQGISNKLDLTLRQKNGMVRHDFFYPLMEEERAHLLKIVEQFCQQQAGKTLNDYYAQLDMEREAPPELTAGTKRLPVDAVSFTDEITECDGKLNFYIPINFDPDEVFGTNVASAFNDDWLNVYANFDWKTGRIDSALTVCLVCSDGHEFEFFYPLTSAEQVQLWDQMDAYCRQQSGQTLGETRTSLLREQAEEGLEIRL